MDAPETAPRSNFWGTVRRKLWSALALLAVVVLGCAGLIAWNFDALNNRYWDWQAGRPLTEAQLSAISNCQNVGWYTLLRALEHDARIDCGPQWLIAQYERLESPRRTAWMSARARAPGSAVRRWRTALLLVENGFSVPTDFTRRLWAPGFPEAERNDVLTWLTDDPRPWIDPRIRERLVLNWAPEGDPVARRALAGSLRRLAVHRDPELQDAVEAGLGTLGVDQEGFQRLRERQSSGMPSNALPVGTGFGWDWRGEECRDLESPRCGLRLAEGLAPEWEGAVRHSLATPLWETLYGPRTTRDLEQESADWAAWVRQGETEDARAIRITSLVLATEHHFRSGVWREAGGDPGYAWRLGRSSPWSTALAAVILAEAAGVPVEVRALGDGVLIKVGRYSRGLGPCGVDLPIPPTEGEIWEGRAVLSQAVLEAVGVALRKGDADTAHRLVTLAGRLDRVGSNGADQVVAEVEPLPLNTEADWALKAGSSLFPVVPPPRGAEPERKLRANLWRNALAEWQRAEVGVCPSTLGP